MSYANSSNPFYTEEENDDDYRFGNKGRNTENPHQRKQQLVNESEDRQLESTQRALASIYESQSMGIATADELVRQAEQLDNIERKTGAINESLTTSQKHINNIKSVFGGIKNWWGGKKQETKATENDGGKASKLKETVEREKKKSAQYQGFYEDSELDSKFLSVGKRDDIGMSNGQKVTLQPISNSAREKEVEENLGAMSEGMSILKNLAIDLGGEIGRQNTQLDRINEQVGIADTRVGVQNKQIKQILK